MGHRPRIHFIPELTHKTSFPDCKKCETDDALSLQLCLGMRHEVTVEVRARYVMLENDDNGTACRNVEEGEDTEFDCRLRCRMKMIRVH